MLSNVNIFSVVLASGNNLFYQICQCLAIYDPQGVCCVELHSLQKFCLRYKYISNYKYFQNPKDFWGNKVNANIIITITYALNTYA